MNIVAVQKLLKLGLAELSFEQFLRERLATRRHTSAEALMPLFLLLHDRFEILSGLLLGQGRYSTVLAIRVLKDVLNFFLLVKDLT